MDANEYVRDMNNRNFVGFQAMGCYFVEASLVAQTGKNLPAILGDPSLIPGLGRSPGEGNSNPLQYSFLENSIDRGYSPWGHKESDMTEQLTL